jgi:hypothetical protein
MIARKIEARVKETGFTLLNLVKKNDLALTLLYSVRYLKDKCYDDLPGYFYCSFFQPCGYPDASGVDEGQIIIDVLYKDAMYRSDISSEKIRLMGIFF